MVAASEMKRLSLSLLALAAISMASIAASSPASAATLSTKLVWASRGFAYIVCADSNGIRVGDRVTFTDRGKQVAAARVVRVDAGGLATAELESGQLADSRRWKKLRLAVESTPLEAPPVMRLGVPSVVNDFAYLHLGEEGAHVGGARYRLDLETEHQWRLVRRSAASEAAGWPDTIVAREFDESADEEIALERGELDAALFWPGQLSSRLRQDQRWWDGSVGTRDHGMVVVFSLASDRAGAPIFPTTEDLSALNRELFRGDLGMWGANPPSAGTAPGASSPARRPRLETSGTWNGRARVESWWNGSGASSSPSPTPQILIALLGAPISDTRAWLADIADLIRTGSRFGAARRASADSVAAEMRRERAAAPITPTERDQVLRRLAAMPAYTIRMTVASALAFRNVVRSLGPDSLVRIVSYPALGDAP